MRWAVVAIVAILVAGAIAAFAIYTFGKDDTSK